MAAGSRHVVPRVWAPLPRAGRLVSPPGVRVWLQNGGKPGNCFPTWPKILGFLAGHEPCDSGELGAAWPTLLAPAAAPCQHQPSPDTWGEPARTHLGTTAKARSSQICCLLWMRLIQGGHRRLPGATCYGGAEDPGRNLSFFPFSRGPCLSAPPRCCWLQAWDPPAVKISLSLSFLGTFIPAPPERALAWPQAWGN